MGDTPTDDPRATVRASFIDGLRGITAPTYRAHPPADMTGTRYFYNTADGSTGIVDRSNLGHQKMLQDAQRGTGAHIFTVTVPK